MKKVGVIGSGFASLSAASHLARQNFDVTVFEKNSSFGGRARQFKAEGFTYDMGPSWYWMPDVFDSFFQKFGHSVSDFYSLTQLDPGFRVFFGQDTIDVPAKVPELMEVFESLEPGAGSKLESFLADGAYKYQVGMQDLVYKSGLRIGELVDQRLIKALFRLHIATPFDRFVANHFKHPYLRRIMEFPILFLGASPSNTPALYSLMNYAGLQLGTWYPQGGMHKIVEAMVELAERIDVQFQSNHEVQSIAVKGNRATALELSKGSHGCDYVVAGADYHHVESALLPSEFRNYTNRYWENRTMAPSSVLYYLGVDRKLSGLAHHNLFFDEDLYQHAKEIYDEPQWPSKPLFYACCPSITDSTVAPEGMENLFLLIPVAPGLSDDLSKRELYFDTVMNRLENLTGQSIKKHIIFRKDYSHSNFIQDYYSFKGNAYGLANTLRQTANLKPKIRNKQLRNLYYTGHLTVPGPGVPPSIISGEVVANEIAQSI